MDILSNNVLAGTMELLQRIQENKYQGINELCMISVSHMDSYELFLFCKELGLVYLNSGTPSLSERGRQVLDIRNNSTLALREILYEYIIKVEPGWAARAPLGRKELYTVLSPDERACFFETGLMKSPPDKSIVDWWDRFSESTRFQSENEKMDIGRQGESFSFEYEKLRTGKIPTWVALESNVLGYDILSITSEKDTRPLRIEVKATSDHLDYAYFHVSYNEWESANMVGNHLFHLWCLRGFGKRLAIITMDMLAKHIPDNNGSGIWESVRIPYREYSNLFRDIDLGDYVWQ